MYVPSLVFRDLKTDSTITQAQRDVGLRMQNEKLFKGGDIEWDGIIFKEIEDIVNRSIISGIQPIEIKGEIEKSIFKIYHPVQNKLVQIFSKKTELKHLKNAYLHYGKKSISIKEENNIRTYNIPVFELEN